LPAPAALVDTVRIGVAPECAAEVWHLAGAGSIGALQHDFEQPIFFPYTESAQLRVHVALTLRNLSVAEWAALRQGLELTASIASYELAFPPDDVPLWAALLGAGGVLGLLALAVAVAIWSRQTARASQILY